MRRGRLSNIRDVHARGFVTMQELTLLVDLGQLEGFMKLLNQYLGPDSFGAQLDQQGRTITSALLHVDCYSPSTSSEPASALVAATSAAATTSHVADIEDYLDNRFNALAAKHDEINR